MWANRLYYFRQVAADAFGVVWHEAGRRRTATIVALTATVFGTLVTILWKRWLGALLYPLPSELITPVFAGAFYIGLYVHALIFKSPRAVRNRLSDEARFELASAEAKRRHAAYQKQAAEQAEMQAEKWENDRLDRERKEKRRLRRRQLEDMVGQQLMEMAMTRTSLSKHDVEKQKAYMTNWVSRNTSGIIHWIGWDAAVRFNDPTGWAAQVESFDEHGIRQARFGLYVQRLREVVAQALDPRRGDDG